MNEEIINKKFRRTEVLENTYCAIVTVKTCHDNQSKTILFYGIFQSLFKS